MRDPLDSVRSELSSLADSGLVRRMRPIDGAPDTEVLVDGRRVVQFSSNNYLGLATNPGLLTPVDRAAGFGASGSRLISGSVAAHRELEDRLARWLLVERALLFNSGYQANVGLVSALGRAGDLVVSDELNHASLIDGCRLSRADVEVYPHRSLDGLEKALNARPAPRKIVITESLFSMDGSTPDLRGIAAVCRRAGALLVVDEAHAVGAVGPRGTGLAAERADLVVGTFGKAFGGFGAYVAGRGLLIELISQRARSFIFSTALPGLVSTTNQRALEIIDGPEGEDLRKQLEARRVQLAAGLAQLELGPASGSQIQPIFVRDPDPLAVMRLSDELLDRGLFVQGIRPPTVPRGTSRLRVALMATHTSGQIDRLLEALAALRPHLTKRSGVS